MYSHYQLSQYFMWALSYPVINDYHSFAKKNDLMIIPDNNAQQTVTSLEYIFLSKNIYGFPKP